jgi:integrase
MPRTRSLTWQPGSDGRPGRWRKKYRGRAYYFNGGRGKSDQAANKAAQEKWVQLRAKIEAETPKRHQLDYEREIANWDRVLAWSRQYDDQPMAEIAINAIARLRTKLSVPVSPPLAMEDTFDGYFEPEVRSPWLAKMIRELGSIDTYPASTVYGGLPGLELDESGKIILPPEVHDARDLLKWDRRAAAGVGELPRLKLDKAGKVKPLPEFPGLWDSLKQEIEIWRDRLKVMQRSAASADPTIATYIESFLKAKQHEARAGSISAGRLDALRLYLTAFADWLGGSTAVNKISGQVLIDYRLHLLRQVEQKERTRTTVGHRLSTVKTFVRWLWQIEAIIDLPRVLDPKSKMLEIGKSSRKILTFTEAEIARLLGQASERSQLYLLLTLNTSMTQKDIADLDCSEVDWEQGRIIRKRSKTRSSEQVPLVNYKLWPETMALLKKHRSHQPTGRVLLNARGEPLWQEQIDANGKYKKQDNVRNAFNRLRKKTGVDKPFKCLKKTSASLLRESEQFNSVVDLFLGHAPQKMSERHYAADPQQLLDRAIGWLRDHYAQHQCFVARSSELGPIRMRPPLPIGPSTPDKHGR